MLVFIVFISLVTISCTTPIPALWQFVDMKEVDKLLSTLAEINVDGRKVKITFTFTPQTSHTRCRPILCTNEPTSFYPSQINFYFENVKELGYLENDFDPTLIIKKVWIINKDREFYMEVDPSKIIISDISSGNYFYFKGFKIIVPELYKPDNKEAIIIEFIYKNKTYLVKSNIDNY